MKSLYKLLTGIFGVIVISLLFSVSLVSASETELTENEITQRFLEIDQNYDIGEELNSEDEAFVKKYSEKQDKSNENLIQPMASTNFFNTGSRSGYTGAISGYLSSDHGWANNSFSANVTAQQYGSSGNVTKNHIFITHTAFGIVGSGGVGKVYSNTVSDEGSGNSNNYSVSRNYTASVAYSTTRAYVDFTISGTDFTVQHN